MALKRGWKIASIVACSIIVLYYGILGGLWCLDYYVRSGDIRAPDLQGSVFVAVAPDENTVRILNQSCLSGNSKQGELTSLVRSGVLRQLPSGIAVTVQDIGPAENLVFVVVRRGALKGQRVSACRNEVGLDHEVF